MSKPHFVFSPSHATPLQRHADLHNCEYVTNYFAKTNCSQITNSSEHNSHYEAVTVAQAVLQFNVLHGDRFLPVMFVETSITPNPSQFNSVPLHPLDIKYLWICLHSTVNAIRITKQFPDCLMSNLFL